MKVILVIGAGRSAYSLVSYLLNNAQAENWKIMVADLDIKTARQLVGDHARGEAIGYDINKREEAGRVIQACDVVLSLLPPALHPEVAVHCIQQGKHLLTASYVSDSMKQFHSEALQKGLLFLNECGLDPGIDHMSIMKEVQQIKNKGLTLHSLESYTGGIIAPETDPGNPWRYKFTWNPRNVVLAGQGMARFVQEGEDKLVPYHQLFKRTTPILVEGYGEFEGYYNRDSLSYIEPYQLHTIQTIIRGTLRSRGFCEAWNILVQLGCCDDTTVMKELGNKTHKSFMEVFLSNHSKEGVEEKIAHEFSLHLSSDPIRYLNWSGLFSEEKIGLNEGTPAQILQHILNKKWELQSADKDMIVMWHRFRFIENEKVKTITSSMVVVGEDKQRTAMAKTVGLPLGIAAKYLLKGKIKSRGVVLPLAEEFYQPILKELEEYGVVFKYNL